MSKRCTSTLGAASPDFTVGRTPTFATPAASATGPEAPSTSRSTSTAYTPKGGSASATSARLHVGKPRVRPRRSPATTVPESMWGRPSMRVTSSSSPRASASRTRELDQGPRSSPTRSWDRVSKPRLRAQARQLLEVARAVLAEAEVVADDDDGGVQGRDERGARTLRATGRRTRRSKRQTTSVSSRSIRRTQLLLAMERGEQRGHRTAEHGARVRGEGEHRGAEAAAAGVLDHGREHRLMAAVHAVEVADGDDLPPCSLPSTVLFVAKRARCAKPGVPRRGECLTTLPSTVRAALARADHLGFASPAEQRFRHWPHERWIVLLVPDRLGTPPPP